MWWYVLQEELPKLIWIFAYAAPAMSALLWVRAVVPADSLIHRLLVFAIATISSVIVYRFLLSNEENRPYIGEKFEEVLDVFFKWYVFSFILQLLVLAPLLLAVRLAALFTPSHPILFGLLGSLALYPIYMLLGWSLKNYYQDWLARRRS